MEYLLDEKGNRGNGKPITYIKKNDCWECTSHSKMNSGYLRINRKYKGTSMHRYIYELYHGKIPEDMVVMHKCDNILCVNPEHFQLGTQKDNIQDMIKKGRKNPAKGESIGIAKVNNEIARQIIYMRYVQKMKIIDIRNKFNLAHATTSYVINFKTWTHITIPYYNLLREEGKIL